MINEERTLKDFDYNSTELSHGSHKKVWRICDICKEEKLVIYQQYRNLCLKCSRGTNEYRSKRSEILIGSIRSKRSKSKQSKAMFGKNNPMFGKTKEQHPTWKGGYKVSKARAHAKRKQFGFIPHNKHHEGFDGHHIDINHVIFIPVELHRSISHSVTRNLNMDKINNIVCEWFLISQGILI